MARSFKAHVGGVRNSNQSARRAMKEVIARYEKLIVHIENVTPEVLFDALEPTFYTSLVYVPKDTGDLSQSGYIEIVDGSYGKRVEMGYGKGGDPDYAVAVHENMEWRHRWPTRAKFLQSALEEDEQEIQARIVEGLQKVFK